jgi:lipoyl(octanoyl) transferase
MGDAISVEWLGRVPYGEALALQEAAVADRVEGRTADRLLLLEHPPVVTFGRSAKPGHLLIGEEGLRQRGVELFEVARGGDVTYHAPGQLVGYPIVDLSPVGRRDVHAFLRELEAGLIDALETWSIPACRVAGRTGVFVDRSRSRRPRGPQRKIASIGIGLRRWVTWHGFALNVDLDLAGFDAIVPCGLSDVVMTSVARELAIERGEDEGTHAGALPNASAGAAAVLDPATEQDLLGARVRESVARALVDRLAR